VTVNWRKSGRISSITVLSISDRVFETLQEFKTVNFHSPTEAGCLNFITKIIYF